MIPVVQGVLNPSPIKNGNVMGKVNSMTNPATNNTTNNTTNNVRNSVMNAANHVRNSLMNNENNNLRKSVTNSATNPIKIAKPTSILNSGHKIRAAIYQAHLAANKANPMRLAYDASKKVTEATHVKGAVSYVNVVYFLFRLISLIFWLMSWFISATIWGLYFIITTLGAILIFITPFLPIFIVIILVGFVSQKVWDVVVTPIFKALIDGYNGVIKQWNKITDAVRHIGFHVPLRLMGKDLGFDVNLGGINLPHGNEANLKFLTFREFIVDILYYSVLEPLMIMTGGYIFRSHKPGFTADDLNKSIDKATAKPENQNNGYPDKSNATYPGNPEGPVASNDTEESSLF